MHMTSPTTTNRAVFGLLLALGLPLAAMAQTTNQPTPPTAGETLILEKFTVEGMKAFSDQAIAGETPVAFTELGKEIIAKELGSQDIPLVLNSTPSVYATTDGGAAGDARVNVRGFSQRNVSILINGVPTNDIENGWLYWSNWDGLGDVTASIQMQRGLSNVTLPTPSIGGTMNIITDPASVERGGSTKFEMGSDSFMKATAVLSTGMLKDKFALTVAGVRKVGQGNPRGAWSDALGYYVGATWVVNDQNRLEFFAIGAPQQHGQRRFASNIAAFSVEFAKELGFTDTQIYNNASGANAGAMRQGPIDVGQDFNQNYGPVSANYNGQQYYWGGVHNRYNDDTMNEIVNYFHKPQMNVNWYLNLSEQLSATTVFYYSGGRGGGSGTLGSLLRYPNGTAYFGNVDWNATIARNQANTVGVGGAAVSRGILRNSVNNQDQFGVVTKGVYELSDTVKLTAGVDWRTAEIDHFREVRDLLGGTYYLASSSEDNEFWANGLNTQLRLGDKVDYDNTNTVDWLGLFLQGQYEKGPLTAFGVYGYSTISYSYVDHFRRAAPGSSDELTLDSPTLDGQQLKGGVSYAFNDQFSAFSNIGWVSKTPIFDGVINDVVGVHVPNPQNEKFNSYEAGLRWQTKDRKFNVSASFYHTLWRNRTVTIASESANTLTYLRGVNSNYSGVEIESAYQPTRYLRFDVAASFGDWTYQDDTQGEVFNITSGARTASNYYIRDVRVGDAPQSQVAYAVTVRPLDGLSVKLQGRWYDRYWADFTPESRTVAGDYAQPWQLPSYSIYDLHITYDLPFKNSRFDVTLFGHVFNLFDEMYISDATDESQFEAVGLNLASRHSAQRAEVFLGPPVSYNIGATIKF